MSEAMHVDQVLEEPMPDSPMPDTKGYDPSSIAKYPFPIEQIPRLSVKDPKLYQYIESSQPVIITDSDLVSSAMKWDLNYLKQNLGNGLFYVYTSQNNKFKYYDSRRAKKCHSFVQPTQRREVTFSKFLEMLKACGNDSKERIYLQQTLNDTVGPNIVRDYLQFNWQWASSIQTKQLWGDLTSNLLLIGQEGNITPVHYDEQQNFFCQVTGYKRCLLFSPDQFECLYPHPVSHPCDRQSQVDFNDPDYERFPKFREAHACEAIVGPGDVLYIPMYWWHQIESLASVEPCDFAEDASSSSSTSSVSSLVGADVDDCRPITVSVNFWYRASPLPQQVTFPISPEQRVSVMRNIEKMLGAVFSDPQEVGALLRAIVDGRYDDTTPETIRNATLTS